VVSFVDRVFVNRGTETETVSTAICLDGVPWRDLNESKRYTIFSRKTLSIVTTHIEIFLNPTEIFFLITIASLNYYGHFYVPCVCAFYSFYILLLFVQDI
jgi:hypothetical protein